MYSLGISPWYCHCEHHALPFELQELRSFQFIFIALLAIPNFEYQLSKTKLKYFLKIQHHRPCRLWQLWVWHSHCNCLKALFSNGIKNWLPGIAQCQSVWSLMFLQSSCHFSVQYASDGHRYAFCLYSILENIAFAIPKPRKLPT